MSKGENVNGSFVKLDDGKPSYNFCAGLLPCIGSPNGVEGVLKYGATKYARDNWKLGGTPEDIKRNVNAAIRHLSAYLDGIERDAESQLLHLSHAAADILFALHHTLSNKSGKGSTRSGDTQGLIGASTGGMAAACGGAAPENLERVEEQVQYNLDLGYRR